MFDGDGISLLEMQKEYSMKDLRVAKEQNYYALHPLKVSKDPVFGDLLRMMNTEGFLM